MILTGVHNPADKKIPTLRNIVKMSMVSKVKTQGNKILCHWFSLIQTIWQHTWMTVNCGLSGERPSKPACVRCVWIPIGMVTLWSGRWKWLWKKPTYLTPWTQDKIRVWKCYELKETFLDIMKGAHEWSLHNINWNENENKMKSNKHYLKSRKMKLEMMKKNTKKINQLKTWTCEKRKQSR